MPGTAGGAGDVSVHEERNVRASGQEMAAPARRFDRFAWKGDILNIHVGDGKCVSLPAMTGIRPSHQDLDTV